MAEKKITKKDNYTLLYDVVEASNVSPDRKLDLMSFIDHELELLEKRANSSASSLTANQKANMVLKQEMLDAMDKGKEYRANEFVTMEEFADRGLSLNKFSAMLKQLKDEGKIVAYKNKKVTTFALAETAD